MTESFNKLPWRSLGWGTAILLLAGPFIAMRFTSEVNWSVGDFVFAGGLLAVIGGGIELAVLSSESLYYRCGAALALVGALAVTWTNLAVGIVGSERNPANVYFFIALAVGLAGTLVARFRARGMSRAMAATGASLWIAFAIAILQPTDEPFVSHGLELAGTSLFAIIFLGSAGLLLRASRS